MSFCFPPQARVSAGGHFHVIFPSDQRVVNWASMVKGGVGNSRSIDVQYRSRKDGFEVASFRKGFANSVDGATQQRVGSRYFYRPKAECKRSLGERNGGVLARSDQLLTHSEDSML